nr:chorismate-binding protein [uncultured Sphingomonas sp.]
MTHTRSGQVTAISRRLTGHYDPVELAGRFESPFFFRRMGDRALILIDSALSLEATGGYARIDAVSEGGALLLPVIADALAANVTAREERSATFSFAPCTDPDEAVRAAAPTALDTLRAMVATLTSIDRDEPFALTALGVVGFDHVDMLEGLPPRPEGHFPDLLFRLAETLVVVEANGSARVLAMAAGSNDPGLAHRQHHLAAERLARTVTLCEARREDARVIEAPTPVAATPDLDDAAFAETVDLLKSHIAAGDIFQVVPSRVFRARCSDSGAAFRRLMAADPSAYNFRFDSGHGVLFGASPETAVEVRIEGDKRTVIVRPIAGTRPRGLTPDQDDRHEADLRLDQKEVAEHMMLVDLARNDVARVAAPGTRRVSRLLDTLRFQRVMHLESTVEGELAEGQDAIDVIRTCLNVGTLSGAPKLKAIELIRKVETAARGPYGGAIGYLTGDGSMDTAVVIRSALVRDGIAEVRAGAGIVADSDPLSEAAETRVKASAVLSAIGVAA